ncbi:hypothetical protein HY639_04700 [Candidatus Woesearchaeota archaeon]|nr:hypothetical protein [Candidatus Woesearchaeota archaeon]
MKLSKILALALALHVSPVDAQVRIRIGEDVSHQSYRFREYFPDHDWGWYRDRQWYGGPGPSAYFSNGKFSIYIAQPYQRRVQSPWQPRALSEGEGRAALENYFDRAQVDYIRDVRLQRGDGRVKTVDFMVDLGGWVPVEYVPEEHLVHCFSKDKQVYDATHGARYIMIPPSTAQQLEERIICGFRENEY